MNFFRQSPRADSNCPFDFSLSRFLQSRAQTDAGKRGSKEASALRQNQPVDQAFCLGEARNAEIGKRRVMGEISGGE